MHSSAVMTLRALVMLICLVLVPLAAVFGSSLPQIFNSFIEEHGIAPLVTAKNDAKDARHRGGDAPVFSAAPVSVAGEAPAPPAPLDNTASLWAPGSAAPNNPAGMPPRGPAARSGGIIPAVGQMSLSSGGAPPAREAVAAPSPVGTTADPFPQLEGRLREMGATYYFLETGGVTGRQYRFHCKVAVAENPNHTRHFDATGDDPLQTMRNVLAQIEQWRAGGQP